MDQLCIYYEEQVLQIDTWVNPSDRLLILNGTQVFLEQLNQRRILFLNICTSKGLFLSTKNFENSKFIEDIDLLGFEFKANKFVNGSPLPGPKELKMILSRLRKYLDKVAQLCFWYENGLYFQEILDRASREQRPWPGHLPKIYSWDKNQFLEFCFANQLNCIETSAEKDQRVNDENYLNYKFVNGVDCKLELPFGADRDAFFEKKFFHICQLV